MADRKSDESGKMRKESSQTLTEDGIYKLRMNAADMAGHEIRWSDSD